MDNATLKARQIYNKYADGEPLNLEYVVSQEGVILNYPDLPDKLCGIYNCIDGISFIGINRRHYVLFPKRARFTLAHEFGHHFLDWGTFLMCSEDETTASEQRANRFAAELLIPIILLKREVHSLSLTELADYFRVSIEAMEYRLKNTRLWNDDHDIQKRLLVFDRSPA